jgi:hypothetical protein
MSAMQGAQDQGQEKIYSHEKYRESFSYLHVIPNMKTFLFLLPIFISNLVYSQDFKKSFNFKQVAWSINLPANFKSIDSVESVKKTARGLKAIEEANNLELDISSTQTLFTGRINGSYFDATIKPFNQENGDYKATSAYSREMLFKTFQSKMTGTKVDSSLTTFLIDGIVFDKFQITVTMDNQVLMTMVLLGKHLLGYNLYISYLYREQTAKEQIEHCLTESKFQKKQQ